MPLAIVRLDGLDGFAGGLAAGREPDEGGACAEGAGVRSRVGGFGVPGTVTDSGGGRGRRNCFCWRRVDECRRCGADWRDLSHRAAVHRFRIGMGPRPGRWRPPAAVLRERAARMLRRIPRFERGRCFFQRQPPRAGVGHQRIGHGASRRARQQLRREFQIVPTRCDVMGRRFAFQRRSCICWLYTCGRMSNDLICQEGDRPAQQPLRRHLRIAPFRSGLGCDHEGVALQRVAGSV